MNNISIVFSKDRPFQLEVFIASFKRFGVEHQLCVLYCTTNYKKEYEKLASKYPDVQFFEEKESFKKSLRMVIKSLSVTGHIGLFVDDNIIISKLAQIKSLNKFSCYSNRLGFNIKRSYPDGNYLKIPNTKKDRDCYYFWSWLIRKNNPWYYMPSLDGDYIPTWLVKSVLFFDISGPNTLEKLLNRVARLIPMKYIFKEESAVVGVPHNIVQDEWENDYEGHNASDLNTRLFCDNDRYIAKLHGACTTHLNYDYIDFIHGDSL